MSNLESDDKTMFAKWALALFIVGLLGAILIAAFSPIKELAGVFLGVSLLLALILGIVGWRHTAGKIAVCGVVGLLVLSTAVSIFYFFLEIPREIPMKPQIYSDGPKATHTPPTERPTP